MWRYNDHIIFFEILKFSQIYYQSYIIVIFVSFTYRQRILHQWLDVIRGPVKGWPGLIEVMMLVAWNIGEEDLYVIVPIWPLLLVHLSYSVHKLVHNGPRLSIRRRKKNTGDQGLVNNNIPLSYLTCMSNY